MNYIHDDEIPCVLSPHDLLFIENLCQYLIKYRDKIVSDQLQPKKVAYNTVVHI